MKKMVNGIIVNMTADEIAARNTDINTWNNSAFDIAIADVRLKRNALLAETDHLALSDNTLTTEMTTYRTKLRDLPGTVTDENTAAEVDAITFPTKP